MYVQGISTGVYHAAIMTNCQQTEEAVRKAGIASGDLTFPIPYTPELHFREFDSAVADMKNSVMVSRLQLKSFGTVSPYSPKALL